MMNIKTHQEFLRDQLASKRETLNMTHAIIEAEELTAKKLLKEIHEIRKELGE